MQRLIFAIAALTLALTASSVARADFAIVRFPDGYCQIWWDGSATPWGVNWTKVAMTPDWASADSALYAAISARICN